MFVLKKIQSKAPEFQTLCNYIIEAMNNLIVGTPTEGRLLTDVVVTSGVANVVDHRLGRTPVGYIVTKYSAQVAEPIWQTSITDKQITLRTGTTCTVDIWVF